MRTILGKFDLEKKGKDSQYNFVDLLQMGKLPFVSVLCATYKRQHLIPFVIYQYSVQTYPIHLRELIIYDDSPSPIPINTPKNAKNVSYIHDEKRWPIGYKRNFLNRKAKGKVIVWFDDDDFYFRNRIEKSVALLLSRMEIELIGAKSTLLFDVNNDRAALIKHKPGYIQNNVLAYRKSFTDDHQYNQTCECHEERLFVNDIDHEKVHQFDGNELCIHVYHGRNVNDKKMFFTRANEMGTQHIIELINDEIVVNYLRKMSATVRNMHFTCVNMKQDGDRLSKMSKQMTDLGLKFQRFNAYTADDIEGLYTIKKSISSRTKTAEIACMCSHLGAIKQGLKYGSGGVFDYFIIMEDDISFCHNFKNDLHRYVENAPCDWEILQIHHFRLDNTCNYTSTWTNWHQKYFSTGLYVIKNVAAARILDRFTNHDDDKILRFNYGSTNEPIRSDSLIYKNCKTYTLTIPIVLCNLEFESNIQTDFHVKKPIIEKFQKKMEERINIS